jgi:uncharacterized protein (UPF0210 family)
MKIRSITSFFDPRADQSQRHLDKLTLLAQEGRKLYEQSGLEVQTVRLATVPFPLLYQAGDTAGAVQLARALEADAKGRGFAYLSLGPALPERLESFDFVIPILEATENVFLSGMMATREGGISLPAVKACARIIARAAAIGGDGFANLRFGALANLGPHGPFLPGAYHRGERPAFAIAVESADLAVDALRRASSLAEARSLLITALEDAATEITARAAHLSQQYGLDFKGLDFSLAPYPQDWCSLGGALEALGLPALGMAGSVAAAAFIADTLDRGRWLKTGFNGLMLPVLEDSVLARRAAQGSLTLKDLLIYSAMCGAGLDTVPLPGDASPEQLEGVLLDVAAIALRLNKPLIARLMPLPGKQAGDPVEFSFEFFAKGAVLALPAAALSRGFAGDETISIRPRGSS